MMRPRSSATIGAMLLSVSYALAMFNRNAGTVLAVVLAVSFQLDPAQVSVVATAFFWVYALLQLPAGILADVLGPRRLAVLGGLVAGAGSFAFAAAQTVAMAAVGRGVIAAGCAVVFVSLMRHIRANWPERRVATLSGRGILIGNLGAIASAAPLSFVLGFVDWRHFWIGFGVVSLIGATVLWFVMADAKEPQHPRERVSGIGEELRAVVSNPANLVGLLLLAGLAGSYYALASLWAVPMLVAHGVALDVAAVQTSVLIAGYAIGACLLGWLGDRTSRRWTLTAACTGAVFCWAGLASAWGTPIDAMSMGLLLFLLGFCSGGFGLVYVLVTARNPLEHSGTVTAFVNIGIFLGAGTIQLISTNLYVASHADFKVVVAPMLVGALTSIVLSLSFFYRRVGARAANPDGHRAQESASTA